MNINELFIQYTATNPDDLSNEELYTVSKFVDWLGTKEKLSDIVLDGVPLIMYLGGIEHEHNDNSIQK